MRPKWTRRQVLAGATLAGAASGFGIEHSALADVTLGPHTHETGGDILVVLFLRGGADGLNVIVPYFEDEYYKLRPSLAIPSPNDRRADTRTRALDLNG